MSDQGQGSPPRFGGSPEDDWSRHSRVARLRRLRELWGRRAVALGVILVAAALTGGIVLLLFGSGSKGDSDNGTISHPVPSIAELRKRFLGRTVADAESGIAVRMPVGWSAARRSGAVTLSSPARCLAMTLSAPAPASGANALGANSLALFRRTYADVKVRSVPSSPVGGIPTTSRSVSFTERGKQVRALLSVGTGRRKAYLTEIVVRSPACQDDLRLAQLSLSSIRYSR